MDVLLTLLSDNTRVFISEEKIHVRSQNEFFKEIKKYNKEIKKYKLPAMFSCHTKSVTAQPGDTVTFSVYLAVDENETRNHGN